MNPHATAHQVGGTVGMSFDQAAHRVDAIGGGRGQDPTGLGRWTWTRFRGKGQMCLRVVVVYVPCVSTGPLSVWSQHLSYFNKLNDNEWTANPDPRKRLFTDLAASIYEWIDDGDQLLVMGDWNVDVREHTLTDFFAPHGMREVLLERHGESAPATCNMGSSPIDGIWATSSLDIARGGYCNFEEGLPSNHRTLWVDLTYMSAFGHKQPAIVRRTARRLKLNDPRCTSKYIKYRKAHAKKHKLRDKHLANERAATYPSDPSADKTHDINDQLTVEGMRWAEQKCRNFRGGGVPWSPTIEKARREIGLVRALIKRRRGKTVSSSLIRRREKQLKLCYHTMTLKELRKQLRKSKAKYRKLKGKAEQLRVSFIESLASARAAANQTSKATELRSMETRRQMRDLGRSMRQLTDKTFTPVLSLTTTTMVEDVAPDGTITYHPEFALHTDKDPMERASLTEYSTRLHLTKDSPPMVPPLVQDIGYLGVGPACQDILDGTYKPPPGIDNYAGQWLSQLSWACPQS